MHNRLEAIRHGRGLTRAGLAQRLPADYVTIWRWETGRMPISHEALLRLARFFQVLPEEILPDLGTIPLPHDDPALTSAEVTS